MDYRINKTVMNHWERNSKIVMKQLNVESLVSGMSPECSHTSWKKKYPYTQARSGNSHMETLFFFFFL